jgi:XTP/dITP diphosphohydrolase
VRDGDRGAHFTCHIAVVNPDTNDEFVVVGNWPGTIAREVHGLNGFGYDPVFIPEGFDVTAAILDPAEKNTLSHRSRALHALAERLGS